MNNRDKTINEILEKPIPRPPDYESYLVKRCFDLANKKLKFFSPEDLRIMIGQNIGLPYLVPIALEILKKDPFIEADYYEGDLLSNVLKIEESFWDKYPKLKEEIQNIFKTNLGNLNSLDLDTQQELFEAFDRL